MIRLYRREIGGWCIGVDGVLVAAPVSFRFEALLEAENPAAFLRDAARRGSEVPPIPEDEVLLATMSETTRLWAAGVTYAKSMEERNRESKGNPAYSYVRTADRPELFFKALGDDLVGHNGSIYLPYYSGWRVSEPEFGVVFGPGGKIIGFVLIDDFSCRDTEGECILYLQQAKNWFGCGAVSPITVPDEPLGPDECITMEIFDGGNALIFSGSTTLGAMEETRTFESLIAWTRQGGRCRAGGILSTGTGIVPGPEISISAGFRRVITSTTLGVLANTFVDMPDEFRTVPEAAR